MIASFWRKWIRKHIGRGHGHIQTRLTLNRLEDRTTPAGLYAVGSVPGIPALVTVFETGTNQLKYSISPFPGFTGGVNVAVGDVNGDGTVDVIVGAGAGGGPIVNVYDGTNGSFLKSFTGGDATSRAGASVAASDFDQDGLADLVVGAIRNGQPLVQVLRFSDGTVIRGYAPFVGATSVSVAAGDVNGDGVPDTIAGSGPGIASQVIAYSGQDDAILRSFNPFESTFLGGVQVTAGDINADSKVDIIVAASVLGGPRVSVYSGLNGAVTSNFFAYDSTLRDGALAAPWDANGDGKLDVLTTNGPNNLADPRAFNPTTLAQISASLPPGLPASTAYDIAAPTVTVTTTATNPTGANPIPFTATFNEAVNGFATAGITVTNGTAGALTKVNAKTYTFSVTPTASGVVSVTVAANAAFDAAGNQNTASAAVSVTYDGTAPTVTINPATTNDPTPTLTGTVSESTATIQVTIDTQTFSGIVAGTTWTATVPTALADGTYTATVTATDTLGNSSTDSDTVIIDTVAPTPTVGSSTSDPTSTTPIPFTITFDEAVVGFDAGDVTIGNGTVQSFVPAGDGITFTVNVTPTLEGAVSVSVASGVAADAAGNSNVASNTFTVVFDTGAITLTANSLTTNDPTPTLSGTVSDSTATVTVTVEGQVISANVVGTNWTATIPVALAAGTYDIQVDATDPQSNTGTLTNTGGLVIDLTAPTPALSSASADPTNQNPIVFTVDFGESVSGFTVGGIDVQNGTAGNIQGSGSTYTFDVTPGDQGTVTVTISAGAAQDAAGNTSNSSNTIVRVFDSVAPIVTVDSLTTNDPTPTLTGTVDDAGATVVVTVGGQNITATVIGTAWSADVPVALPDETYIITATGTDAAGNVGNATPGTLVVDTTAPTVSTVTANPSSGTFTASDTIELTVTFSEAVSLTGGSLQLLLDTGATVTLGQTGDPAIFTGTYTVSAGESSSDLDSTSLSLTGGATLVDAAGNAADLTISLTATLSANADIVIDPGS